MAIQYGNSVGHYPNTALFKPPPKIPWQGSGLSSLGRIIIIMNSQGLMVSPCFWQIFPRGYSARCPVDRSWCAQRCCDGAATESLLRRSCADQLRRAHSARRVRDGADAAATAQMCCAQRCCDRAATESLLRRSCAAQLRRAHSARCVSTRRAE